jgi:DNA-binding NarL/FixJ family response regulator
MRPVRVLIADDHAMVRAGIRALLEKVPDVEVVAEAGDGREALNLTKNDAPDVVLMDIAMSGLNGLEATRRIVEKFPGVHVIMLSMYSDEEYVWKALRSGAEGYLLKGASIGELELAIKSVAQGESYLSPPISKSVILNYIRRAGGAPTQLERLTSRQIEILQLVAEGQTTKQIALTLKISTKTVEAHRKQLMKRLAVRDVASLVRHAVKLGLIHIEAAAPLLKSFLTDPGVS